MPSKVSVVVPCYNKVRWIGDMLQSLTVQKWENVEVILVNDGSTDGTRAVIAQWEPKLKNRGYSVVIIDQDNQGVAVAVRNGLLRASGDFVCQVDCDDRLAPDYISMMAGFLDNNLAYDGVSCAFELEEYDPEKNIECEYTAERTERLRNYILMRMQLSACVYMVRTSYVKRHNMIDSSRHFPCFSQEPFLVIQFLGNDGKFKYIPKGLYLRNMAASDTTRIDSLDKTVHLMGEFYDAMAYYIQFLHKPPEDLVAWTLLTEYGKLKTFLTWTLKFPNASGHRENWINNILNLLKNKFDFPFSISKQALQPETIKFFFAFTDKWVLKGPVEEPLPAPKRIIGYGALGTNAKNYLPHLKNTQLYPTVLWDKDALAVTCTDSVVEEPDFQSLTDDDMLLVFPSAPDVKENVLGMLKNYGKHTKCLYINQIKEYIGRSLFQKY